jgi:hypothetical protein
VVPAASSGALAATARFQIGTTSVFVRVGQVACVPNNGESNPAPCFLLDLADSPDRPVEFGPQGCSLVARPRGQLPAPRWAALAGARVAASAGPPKLDSTLTRELRSFALQLATGDITVAFDRNRERRLIIVSTPGPSQEMPSSEQNAVMDNPLPPNGLTAMTAFEPFFHLVCAIVCGEFGAPAFKSAWTVPDETREFSGSSGLGP